jgi:DNA-binding transcriptional LysR family regulator
LGPEARVVHRSNEASVIAPKPQCKEDPGFLRPCRGPQGQQGLLQYRPRFIADDLLVLQRAVLGGSGMCLLPDYMCEEALNSGRLMRLLP